MAKSFDQHLAETGRQGELDTLRKDGQKYERAKSQYESSGSFEGLNPLPSPTQRPSSQGAELKLPGGKSYGGWYDNANSGRNQRFFGVDAQGNEIWTDGEEPGLPKSEGDVTGFLNNYQNNLFGSSNAPETKIPTADELKKQLQPESGLPPLLNRAEMFDQQREKFGVADLEATLNDLKAAEDEENASFRRRRFDEEGKPVATNVIAGRVTEEERAANERLDAIGRQKSRVVDELNTRYSVIGQYMEFAGLDYQDAVARYETEYNQNVQIYGMIADAKKEERSAFESDRDAARANLQIYMNAITSGNINYSGMSSDQKAMVSKLEVQSGLPVGFMSSVQMNPADRIMFTTTKEGVTQVGIMNENGQIDVQSYGTRDSSGSGGSTAKPGSTTAIRNTFLEEADSLSAYDSGGTTVGVFPQLVKKYANTMSLQDIYRTYSSSSIGKSYGNPSEDPEEIKEIYNYFKGN